MRVACKVAAGRSAGVQRALAAVTDELAAGVYADKRAERSKIGTKNNSPILISESWAVFLCNFLGKAKH